MGIVKPASINTTPRESPAFKAALTCSSAISGLAFEMSEMG